jgi:DtxR family transcriptional regulator, Mn-dependent transcriptional regulator
LIMVVGSASISATMDGRTTVKPPSSSVGDYLKAIWELSEEGAAEGAASTSDVAERLSFSAASVSNMFGRLREMGLAEYERHRGATLTERGREEALRLVRRHRLIETFLVECLGYSWENVHEEAERMEHLVTDDFTERLAAFLGHPAQDPHGDPIPSADGTLEADDSFPLAAATPGQQVRVYRVGDEEPAKLAYLEELGLTPGRVFEVREVRALDGVVVVEDEGAEIRSIGGPLAASVFVLSASEGGSEGPGRAETSAR